VLVSVRAPQLAQVWDLLLALTVTAPLLILTVTALPLAPASTLSVTALPSAQALTLSVTAPVSVQALDLATIPLAMEVVLVQA